MDDIVDGVLADLEEELDEFWDEDPFEDDDDPFEEDDPFDDD